MANSVFIWPGNVSFIGSVISNAGNTLGFITIGGLPGALDYGGLWVGQSSPSGSNYSFLGNKANGQTLFNAPSGGTINDIEFRIANTARMSVGAAGVNINVAANSVPAIPLLVKNAAQNTTLFTIADAGAITTIGTIATAGAFGTAPIVAVSEATGLSAADTNRINYTPAAASGTYRLIGVVNVTAWATPASFTVAATYKDASGNARTDTALVVRGSTGASAAAVTAVDRWYYSFPAIDIDNSATAITVSTTGTFTGTPAYNHAAVLERIR